MDDIFFDVKLFCWECEYVKCLEVVRMMKVKKKIVFNLSKLKLKLDEVSDGDVKLKMKGGWLVN